MRSISTATGTSKRGNSFAFQPSYLHIPIDLVENLKSKVQTVEAIWLVANPSFGKAFVTDPSSLDVRFETHDEVDLLKSPNKRRREEQNFTRLAKSIAHYNILEDMSEFLLEDTKQHRPKLQDLLSRKRSKWLYNNSREKSAILSTHEPRKVVSKHGRERKREQLPS
jgi:hypothetical protein